MLGEGYLNSHDPCNKRPNGGRFKTSYKHKALQLFWEAKDSERDTIRIRRVFLFIFPSSHYAYASNIEFHRANLNLTTGFFFFRHVPDEGFYTEKRMMLQNDKEKNDLPRYTSSSYSSSSSGAANAKPQ